jgi:hypothetical protein
VRWFVVLLVVANLILFVWLEQEAKRDRPAVTALPPPDVGRLELVDELIDETEGRSVAEAPAAGTPSGVARSASLSLDAPEVAAPDDEKTEDPVALEWATPEATAAPGPAEVEAPVTEAVVEEEQATQTPPSPPIVIADDKADVVEAVIAESAAPAPQTLSEMPTVDPVCGRVGPLQPDQAEQLLAELPGSLTLLSDVSEESEKIDNYYVLIPALPNLSAGRQMLEELSAAGISDTWLFRRGPLKNAISLGLFRREAGAKRRVDEVADKGFEAKLHPQVSRVEYRWLFLKHLDGGEIGSSLPLPEGIRVESRDCP